MNQTREVHDAIRFWESCRIPYNILLFVIVAFFWGADILFGGPQNWLGGTVVLLLFAAIANVLYCAAYAGEYCFQKIAPGMSLERFRWVLFGAGLALAVALELWIILRQGMG